MSGFLTPDARLRVFSDLGVVLPGAKLHAYVAGTPATPQDTFSDVDLAAGHENTNPVVADAFGLFGPIFLTPGLAYKLTLTDASDVVVWTQDNVSIPAIDSLAAGPGISLVTVGGVTTISASAGVAGGAIGQNDFRLTLESGVPVSTTDQLAKTAVFCTPYAGNQIALYDALGVPTVVTSVEVSIALPATTGQVYDVFGYSNAGALALELLAWTSDTVRATALTRATTGTWTKTGDLTRRYLGSVRTTPVAGQTEDSLAKRYLWNVSNRVARPMRVLEATDSWTYSTNTWRQARATATNQLDFLIGIAEVLVEATILVGESGTSTSVLAWVAVGEDSTTTPDAAGLIGAAPGFNTSLQSPVVSTLRKVPAVGRHTWVWLEKSNNAAAGVTTFYGDNGADGTVSGIAGTVHG